MLSKFEKRAYVGSEKVWVGKYRNLHNISHWHMEHELIACTKGSAQIMLDDKMYTVNEGQCIFIRSGSTHYIEADDDSTLIVCIFDEKMNAKVTGGVLLDSPVFDDEINVADSLVEIRRELSEQKAFYEKKTETIITNVLIDMLRLLPKGISMDDSKKDMNQYKLLLNNIDSDYEFITFSDAAKFMHFSEAYFSKYFKKQAGMTFSQYLNVVRIEKAVEILNSESEVKTADVMRRCGFSTIRSFNRTFKEITGYTPKSLPKGFSLNTKSVPSAQNEGSFNPTLQGAVLIT